MLFNICATELSCAHPDICILCNHGLYDEYKAQLIPHTGRKLWKRTIAARK